MIGYLEGKIEGLTPSFLYINNNGVGYEVHITLPTYEVINGKTECRLFTHFHIREDAWTIYGFHNPQEKETFQKLITVSGVGAVTARLMLSSIPYQELNTIIWNGDNKALEKVKGIGAKTAQRIILELKGKVNLEESIAENATIHNSTLNDALNALVGLGIAKSMAENALKKVNKNADKEYSVEEFIKLALKNL